MNEIKSIVTIQNIVANVLLEMGEEARKGLEFGYTQFAIRIYKNYLKIFYLPNAKTVKLEISDNGTVTFPNDMTKFIAVGFPHRAEFWTMTRRNQILLKLGEDCGEEEADMLDGVDTGDGEDNELSDGSGYGGYAQSGGINEGYFKPDWENNRLIIKKFTGTHVRLKYVSTGISIDGDTIIPSIAQESMIAGVHWLRTRHDKKAFLADKISSKKEFREALRILKFASKPTVQEFYDIINRVAYQGLKR